MPLIFQIALDPKKGSYTLRCMIRTQIYLTEAEHQGIREIATATQQCQSALIREAIDQYLIRKNPADKLAKIRRAKGIWKDRADLDLAAIRADFDRF
jgi:hypothetical protein